MLRVENKSGNALLLWEPCRIERKETGRIIVAGTQQRVMTLRGTNTAKGAAGTLLLVELTGTNHGPLRVLVPVTRYGLLARLESLFHQPMGSFAMKSPRLKNLLRNSKTWIASEWFDGESTDGPYPFANRAIRIESQNLKNLLHAFYGRFQRWPTNVSEVASYAKAASQPVPASRFDDATFMQVRTGGSPSATIWATAV